MQDLQKTVLRGLGYVLVFTVLAFNPLEPWESLIYTHVALTQPSVTWTGLALADWCPGLLVFCWVDYMDGQGALRLDCHYPFIFTTRVCNLPKSPLGGYLPSVQRLLQLGPARTCNSLNRHWGAVLQICNANIVNVIVRYVKLFIKHIWGQGFETGPL